MKKRLLSLLIAAIMMIAAIPSYAEDAEVLSVIAGVDASKYAELNNLNWQASTGYGLGSSNGYGWAKYENVDFGDSGISEFIVNVSIPASYAGKNISFYVDSIAGSPFAELKVASTGGWGNFKEQKAVVNDTEIYGVHNLYVTIQTTATGNVKSFRATPAVVDEGAVLPQSVIDAGKEEIFSILAALDIIAYDEAKGFNAAAEVQAGEFVKAALMLKGDSSAESQTMILQKAGLKANEGINAEKACWILLFLLNRQEMIFEGSNAYETAAGIDIECAAAPDVAMTWVDALELLYDATEVPPVEISSAIQQDGGVKGVYKAKANNTLLIEYRDIHKSKGILNMDYQTGLTGVSDIAQDQVLINNYIFDIGECNVNDLLGYEVEYYYHSTGYENVLLYIQKTKNNQTLTLSASDIENYSQKTISYYEGQKEKTVKIPDTASIIYNGIIVSKYDSDMFNFKNGSIELISNNRDDVPEVVKLWNAVDYIFAGYSNGILYFKGADDSATTDDLQIQYNNPQYRINLMNTVGIEMLPEKMAEGSVCTIATVPSIDSTFTLYNIWVSKRTVSGTVKSVNKSEGTVKINDEDYKISQAFIDAGMNGIYTGAGIKAYLNKYAEIAFVENDAVSSNMLGFVVRYYIDEDTDEHVLRIFNEDGKMVDYKLHDNVRINGDPKTDSQITSILSPMNELCLFTTNNYGVIREIDFALANSPTADPTRGLYHYADVAATDGEKYKAAGHSLKGGQVILNSEFTLFRIPADFSEYEDYQISGNDFTDDEKVTMKCYNRVVDRLDVTIGVQIYTESENAALTSADIKYVNKVTEEWNGDDTDVIVEYYNGTEQKLKTLKASEAAKATALGLVPGDAIRFRTNALGEMAGIVKCYNVVTGLYRTDGHINGTYSVIKSGTVAKKQDNIIMLTGSDEKFNLISPVYYVFEDGELRVGSLNEIVSAENVGTGSTVWMFTKYGGVKSIVIVK